MLLHDHVFIHLEQPGDKLNTLLQVLQQRLCLQLKGRVTWITQFKAISQGKNYSTVALNVLAICTTSGSAAS